MATITGTSGRDIIKSTELADSIFGIAGDDVLSGLGGDNSIFGGVGNDALNGGPGNDTRPYNQFNYGMMATEFDDQFIYDNIMDSPTLGTLFYDFDGTARVGQVALASLVGVPPLTNNDVFVFSSNNVMANVMTNDQIISNS